MSKETIFKVEFINNGKVYELYTKKVSQSSLLGFVELEDYVFGEASTIVIDPTEDRLKKEFSSVKRSYIPIHAIIRIDEVVKRGSSKISKMGEGGNVISPFPNSATFLKPEKKEKDP